MMNDLSFLERFDIWIWIIPIFYARHEPFVFPVYVLAADYDEQ